MNFQAELDEHQAMTEGLRDLAPMVQATAEELSARVRAGGTVFWFGNGGSASQAEHFAAELVGRYEHERAGLPSLALSTDGAVMTAIANDYSFNEIFARQLQTFCHQGDVAVGLSTSGNSANVLRGIEAARAAGAFTVGMTGGTGGNLVQAVDRALVVPTTRTSRIQEAHLFLGHLLCGHVEIDGACGDQ